MKSVFINLFFSWFSQTLVKSAKVKSLVLFLKVLSGTRKGLITLLIAIFSMQLLVVLFVGLIGIGVYFIPEDTDTKLIILAAVLGVLFVTIMGFLIWLLSEKTWIEKSGAQKLINDLNH